MKTELVNDEPLLQEKYRVSSHEPLGTTLIKLLHHLALSVSVKRHHVEQISLI